MLYNMSVAGVRVVELALDASYLSSYFIGVTDVPRRQRLRSASSKRLTVPTFRLTTVSKRDFPVFGASGGSTLGPGGHKPPPLTPNLAQPPIFGHSSSATG